MSHHAPAHGGASGRALIARLIALACACALAGCEPPPAPLQHHVTIGQQGILYTWRDVEHGFQTASRVEDIPALHRHTVGVWHKGWAKPPLDQIYVVDLDEATSGSTRPVALAPRRVLTEQMFAAHAGADRGLGTAWIAKEIANLHPSSDRQRAARRNREAIEQLRPRFMPTYEEHLKQVREQAAARRASQTGTP